MLEHIGEQGPVGGGREGGTGQTLGQINTA